MRTRIRDMLEDEDTSGCFDRRVYMTYSFVPEALALDSRAIVAVGPVGPEGAEGPEGHEQQQAQVDVNWLWGDAEGMRRFGELKRACFGVEEEGERWSVEVVRLVTAADVHPMLNVRIGRATVITVDIYADMEVVVSGTTTIRKNLSVAHFAKGVCELMVGDPSARLVVASAQVTFSTLQTHLRNDRHGRRVTIDRRALHRQLTEEKVCRYVFRRRFELTFRSTTLSADRVGIFLEDKVHGGAVSIHFEDDGTVSISSSMRLDKPGASCHGAITRARRLVDSLVDDLRRTICCCKKEAKEDPPRNANDTTVPDDDLDTKMMWL
jgi:hypothetical protein